MPKATLYLITQLGHQSIAEARASFMLELLLAVDAIALSSCANVKFKCFRVETALDWGKLEHGGQ